ncbi:MAG: ATP-binding cassette domain-containing protein [Atopobiaceae bacterium]|nr:ATP-binding cassette domain-containing protein [Atopobiaceae bacterium]
MLQLEHVCKSYTTGTFTQVALDDVSLAFRDNEFVSILGPSGSGKTTLLNVIGGLDHFDGGDLLIDGISTREYKDRDWDAYRNNRIGFVFQSYNLIPHQTILANVELALTLSGVNPTERRERARAALEDVGLGEHVDKRPSQLSGGQMQRVAIARALINDPEILLADEPTGALDSQTSVQVMNLLREVADDRLVIMVTHNPELAREYSTRIVELADGRIRSDSNAFVPTESDLRDAKPARRTSMSFLTALSLSFNNLMTKKGRTLMTAFAGSIGIIGIAAILALANGVNAYIQEVEEDTLSAYPLQIMSSGFDMTSLMVDMQGDQATAAEGENQQTNKGQGTVSERRMVGKMFGSVGKNDLASLKEFLDGNGSNINSHVQDIEYKYAVVPQIFLQKDGKTQQINPDKTFAAFGIGNSSSSLVSSSRAFSTNVFSQLPKNLDLLYGQFDIKAGRWPKGRDELVIVLSRNGNIIDFVSYAMGLRDHDELQDMVQKLSEQKDFEVPDDERTYTYEQLMEPTFKVVPAASMYKYEPEYKVWTSKADDDAFMKDLLAKAQQLHIVGVLQPKEDVEATTISQGIYYTPELTHWLMEQAADSKIVQDQLANPSINVISGKSFDAEAKNRGNDFDMSKLFTIDESKITNAFKMDLDALDLSNLDLSSMDFSGLDLSGVSMPSTPMPEMDFSGLQTADFSNIEFDMSKVDLSGVDVNKLLTPEVMKSLTPYMNNIDTAQLMDGVTPTIDQAKLQGAIAQAMAGLPQYIQSKHINPMDGDALSAAMAEYMAQPQVSAQLLQGLSGAVSFDQANREKMAANLRKQMQAADQKLTDEERASINAATEQVASQLAGQVADQLADQLADQIQARLSAVLATGLTSMLQTYMGEVMGTYMAQMSETLSAQMADAMGAGMQSAMENLMSNMGDAFSIDEQAFAEAFTFNMSEKELGELMVTLMSTERTSYDNNIAKLGYADEKKPSEIDIYPINFESKSKVTAILDGYNDKQRAEGNDDKVITYTDIVGALMSSVTEIVNMISYVLIAFVAISLVVSSIMIGVITYISVLERKKEIGILRSIGASKRDVSRVFNAETVIEGLVSGVMGVGITALGCIPANIIVEQNFDVVQVARLPIGAALILIGVSVFLSFIAGLLPSRKAAKADPVEALRSE